MRMYLASVLFFVGCISYSKFPVSDHCDGERFYHANLDNDKSFWDVLKWNFSRPDSDYPEWIENKFKPELPKELPSGKVAATFVNHATFLLQTKNFSFLTDPVWAKRVSPFSFVGPKRIRNAGIIFDELPLINFVVISHNHYDHMDLQAIEDLHNKFKPVFIVPLGNGKHFKDIDGIQTTELDWWQSTTVVHNGETAKITLVPAQHWSARSLIDKRKALWGGYVVETDQRKIYFAGDTGYSKDIFTRIGETWTGFDVALIPIGSYEPRWFMKDNHTNPEESVQVHLDVKSKISVAMHYGAFKLSDEQFGQPEKDLDVAKKKMNVENFILLDVGQTKIF